VESKHTGHDAPTSLTGANTLARDSSHASTRSRGPAWCCWWRLIVVAGFLLPGEGPNQASCLSAVQRRPIHRPLLGLAGSGSACLAWSGFQSWNGFNGEPGVHCPFVVTCDRQRNRCWLRCMYRRKEGIILHATADRQAGRMRRLKSQCGAVLGCARYRAEAAAQSSRICVAMLAEENPNGY